MENETGAGDIPDIPQALVMLMRDHNYARKLADTWLYSNDEQVRKQAAEQFVLAVEAHSKLEEAVFYPAVRALDPELIERFEHVHGDADDLIAALKSTQLTGERAEAMLDELITAVMRHIEQEQSQLFPRVARAVNLDLDKLADEMQVYEANLVHQQAQTGQPGGAWR